MLVLVPSLAQGILTVFPYWNKEDNEAPQVKWLLKAKLWIWEIKTMHSSPVSDICSCAAIVSSCLCSGKVQLGYIYYRRYVSNYVIIRWIIMVGFTDVWRERSFVVFHFGVCSSHHYNYHVRYTIKVTSRNLLCVNGKWQALISSPKQREGRFHFANRTII